MKPFTFLIFFLFFLMSCGNDNHQENPSDNNNLGKKVLAVDTSSPVEEPIAETLTNEAKSPENPKSKTPKEMKLKKELEIKAKQKESLEKDPSSIKSDATEQIVKDPYNDKKEESKETLKKANPAEQKPKEHIIERMKPEPYNHELLNQLLSMYVSSKGKVNYKALKREQSTLETYLSSLENMTVENSWPKPRKMAFWINAYNAYTIKLILDNYPVSSITKLEGGKPWDKKWIKLNGKTLSLNNIENDILRPQFKDARIHFAVNCAAKSCPPLLNRAWTETNLESYLDTQAKAFINNPSYNKITENSVEVSKIFDWYGEDFGDLINYLNKYSDMKINNKAKIGFKEYDWSLNE